MKFRVWVHGDLIVEAKSKEEAETAVARMLEDKAPWLAVSPSSAQPIGLVSEDLLDRLRTIGES